MSRSLLRSALEIRSPITRLPPTFLLPIRARWISSTQQQVEPATTTTTTTTTTSTTTTPTPRPSGPSLEASRSQQTSATIHAKTAAAAAATAAATAASTSSPSNTTGKAAAPPHPNTPRSRAPPTKPPPQPTGPIPAPVRELLPLLRSQPNHYLTVHIYGRPYLVTAGDSIRLPFLMPGVQPGDVLRLNRASVLGSRDFTLKPSNLEKKDGSSEPAYIDERLYECRATVLGVDSEPMRLKEKTKRRNRKVKTVRSKHRFTVLRISELRVKAPEEVAE